MWIIKSKKWLYFVRGKYPSSYHSDVYFFLVYWGQRDWSKTALKWLRYWDMFLMPSERLRMNLYRIMWLLWFIGVLITKERWASMSLVAFMCVVILFAFLQAVFSDNFGGRFELYTRVFLWLGSSCGVLAIVQGCKRPFATG